MYKEFIELIARIYLSIKEKSEVIGLSASNYKTNISSRVEDKLTKQIGPLIDDMFREGISSSNLIVRKEVAKLGDVYKLPFKYNKDLINTFNTDKSIFTGFYDTKYKDVFKKGEIDKLKRTILRGNYSKLSDREIADSIKSTLNVSKQRALTIARQESARLDTAAKSIWYNDPAVNKEFEKVWVSQSDARPEHKWMDGQIADKDGWFTTKSGDKIQGSPLGFGCRCRVVLRRIKK